MTFIELGCFQQLLQFGFLFIGQTVNSLFFNQKRNSFFAAGGLQLLEAVVQLRSRIEVVVQRDLGGNELAKMSAFLMVPPALQ